MDLNLIIEKYVKGIMGQELDVDVEKGVKLLFDDKYTVYIRQDSQMPHQLAHMYSIVCDLPDQNPEAVYPELLEANLFGNKTAGAVFAVNFATQKIVLNRILARWLLTDELFTHIANGFVEALKLWTPTLAKWQDRE